MSNAFFEALETNPELFQPAKPVELRLYWDEEGNITEVLSKTVEEPDDLDYMVITQKQYDVYLGRPHEWRIHEGELMHFPPKHRLWHIEQHELDRNPWIKE